MIQFSEEIMHTWLVPAIEAALAAGGAINDVYATSDFQVEHKADQSPLTLADRKAHGIIADRLTPLGLPLLSEEGREIPFAERQHWEMFWLVDPLDGTKEFIKRNGEFTVNIALIVKGEPRLGVIYAPVAQQLYFGIADVGAFLCDPCPAELSLDQIFRSVRKLPILHPNRPYRVVASRNHLNAETGAFIAGHLSDKPDHELVSRGSSLKLCMIAEGSADIYPRFAPTMEWDTAAGHAVIVASGGMVTKTDCSAALSYNKVNLLNPWFIARGKSNETSA
jgi:3'(2'), 5'-bisphosphate nucleotidase